MVAEHALLLPWPGRIGTCCGVEVLPEPVLPEVLAVAAELVLKGRAVGVPICTACSCRDKVLPELVLRFQFGPWRW